MNFEDLKLTRQFLNAIEEAGFTQATEIQLKAIPRILAGQDVIGIAQTGTGKTAAYLLPLLQQVKYAQGFEPRCLILVPTKELVLQVVSNIEQLALYTDIRYVGLFGGIGPKKQIEALEKGIDIIIATPGRFMELYLKEHIVLKNLKHLVLDEADRMMDMGFMPQIRNILEVIPRKRQNLLFSATFPPTVELMSDEFLLFPQRIEVTPQATPVETVQQKLYTVPNFMSKLNLLFHFLKDQETFHRVIVFVGTKDYAKNIGKFLDRKAEGEIRVIHSDKGQNSRINAMNDFKSGEVRVLVSTDVSARGIDVPDVSHVINFSIPKEYHDYVHRIGRTGRALKTGEAISFMDKSEVYHIAKIEKLIAQKIERFEFPEGVKIEKTPKEENIDQEREIDKQKRRENPDFKGAFHDKKKKNKKEVRNKQKRKRMRW